MSYVWKPSDGPPMYRPGWEPRAGRSTARSAEEYEYQKAQYQQYLVATGQSFAEGGNTKPFAVGDGVLDAAEQEIADAVERAQTTSDRPWLDVIGVHVATGFIPDSERLSRQLSAVDGVLLGEASQNRTEVLRRLNGYIDVAEAVQGQGLPTLNTLSTRDAATKAQGFTDEESAAIQTQGAAIKVATEASTGYSDRFKKFGLIALGVGVLAVILREN